MPWLAREQVLLGDGRMEQLDVYAATVVWDGEPLRVAADAADAEPLVGMALMHGYELNIRNVEGGAVTPKRLTDPSIPDDPDRRRKGSDANARRHGRTKKPAGRPALRPKGGK